MTNFGDASCSVVDLLSALNSLTSLWSTQPHWFEDPFKVMRKWTDQPPFFKVRVFIKVDRLTWTIFWGAATDLTFIKRQHSTCQLGLFFPSEVINILYNCSSSNTIRAVTSTSEEEVEESLTRTNIGQGITMSQVWKPVLNKPGVLLFWTQDCCIVFSWTSVFLNKNLFSQKLGDGVIILDGFPLASTWSVRNLRVIFDQDRVLLLGWTIVIPWHPFWNNSVRSFQRS